MWFLRFGVDLGTETAVGTYTNIDYVGPSPREVAVPRKVVNTGRGGDELCGGPPRTSCQGIRVRRKLSGDISPGG